MPSVPVRLAVNLTAPLASGASALAARACLGTRPPSAHREIQFEAILRRRPEWDIGYRDLPAPDGRTVRAYVGSTYFYRWYYTAVALHQHGGQRCDRNYRPHRW